MKSEKERGKRGEAWWRKLVEKQEKSGGRVADICAEAGVSAWSFYQWRKRFSAPGRHKAGFTEVELGVVNEYEVKCRNGRSIIVRGAVTPSVLSSIIAVTEGGV